MKLSIRAIETLKGNKLMLCDEHGEPLPGQHSVVWTDATPGQPPTLTVTFAVDGSAVALARG